MPRTTGSEGEGGLSPLAAGAIVAGLIAAPPVSESTDRQQPAAGTVQIGVLGPVRIVRGGVEHDAGPANTASGRIATSTGPAEQAPANAHSPPAKASRPEGVTAAGRKFMLPTKAAGKRRAGR